MPMYVNAVEIDDSQVFQEMQYHPAPTREEARDDAARALLIRELLRQEAIKKGLLDAAADPAAAEVATMQLLETEVSVPAATAQACRHYYDQNIERFASAKGNKLPLPFDAVKDQITDYLQTQSMRQGIQAYVLDLAARHRVAGFDLAASL